MCIHVSIEHTGKTTVVWGHHGKWTY